MTMFRPLPSGFGRGAVPAALLFGAALLLAGCSQGAGASDTVVSEGEFTQAFTNVHQDPNWILAREQQLKLTADQVTKLKALQASMDDDRRAKVAAIRAANDRFKADAKVHDANRDALVADARTLSDAQLALTTSVIDGSLAGYAVLDPDQRKQFDSLIACCTKA